MQTNDEPEEVQSPVNAEFAQAMEELLEESGYELPRVGDIRKGTVIATSPQGLIVDLGLKRDGLVQPSDLGKLDEEERARLTLDSEVAVYIVSTNDPDGLIVSISKAMMNQDWIKAQELMESGEIFEAEVIGHNRGGVIVPFGRLRGFVPASHVTSISRGMSDEQRMQRMSQLKGTQFPLKIIEVDRRRRRLVLSQRDAQKEWEEVRRGELLERLTEGDVLTGRVSGLRDFGAFVDLGGADGLIHISELAWHRVNHPREVIRVGEEVDVYILKLNKVEQRISLSRKMLLPNPWQEAARKYEINQLVEGTITRIVSYGAFVEIEPGVEGLLHVSQLSRNKVENPAELVSENERHLLRVVSIDTDRQRMGLSLKAVTPMEQIEWMAQHEVEEAPPADAEDDELAAVEEAAPAETALAEAPTELDEAVDEAVVASVAATLGADETATAVSDEAGAALAETGEEE